MTIVDGADGPADDEAGKQVENRGQIELAVLTDHELARVADRALIRRVGPKLPVEQIRGDRLTVITHRRHLESLARARVEALGLHQPHDSFPTHPQVLQTWSQRETLIRRRTSSLTRLMASNDAAPLSRLSRVIEPSA